MPWSDGEMSPIFILKGANLPAEQSGSDLLSGSGTVLEISGALGPTTIYCKLFVEKCSP